MVLPVTGLTKRPMCCRQAEQPKVVKEGVRPTLVIRTFGNTPALAPFSQQRAQPTAKVLVLSDKYRRPTVAEVLEPAAERLVQFSRDALQAAAARALRFRPQG